MTAAPPPRTSGRATCRGTGALATAPSTLSMPSVPSVPSVPRLRRVRIGAETLRQRLGGVTGGDEGNAIVEFLGVALLLLVPVVYLALTLGRLQAATFAVDGAAREGVRGVVTAPDTVTAEQRMLTAVGLALADQGVEADPAASTTVTCDGTCLDPGATVTVQVAVDVPLPGTAWLQGAIPLSVPVTATSTAVRDSWVAAGQGAG